LCIAQNDGNGHILLWHAVTAVARVGDHTSRISHPVGKSEKWSCEFKVHSLVWVVSVTPWHLSDPHFKASTIDQDDFEAASHLSKTNVAFKFEYLPVLPMSEYLIDLPDDLLRHMLEFLQLIDLISIRQTCKGVAKVLDLYHNADPDEFLSQLLSHIACIMHFLPKQKWIVF
jgi:hypothetical protein